MKKKLYSRQVFIGLIGKRAAMARFLITINQFLRLKKLLITIVIVFLSI